MCLCVINHVVMLDGAILLCVYLMRGEYDDRLVWPFRGDITIQLLNWSSDQYHIGMTVKFNDKSPVSSCSRVTSGERAKCGCEEGFFSLLGSKYDIYVKDDTVKLKVTKVVVAS